jgi:hypothetical protein
MKRKSPTGRLTTGEPEIQNLPGTPAHELEMLYARHGTPRSTVMHKFRSRNDDDFCSEHGRESMFYRSGEPVAFCAECERQDGPPPLVARPGCCEEASTLSHSFYIPCNQPAESIVGWKGRSDKPIRMCAMCTYHNVKNRGGYVVNEYKQE